MENHQDENSLSIDEAINLLRPMVKYSAIPGQKHLDLTLANVDELPKYKRALARLELAKRKGETTEAEVKQKLGLP